MNSKTIILLIGIIWIIYLLIDGSLIQTLKFGNYAVSQKLYELETSIESLEGK